METAVNLSNGPSLTPRVVMSGPSLTPRVVM